MDNVAEELKLMHQAMSEMHVAVWKCNFLTRTNKYTPETVKNFNVMPVMENVPQSLLDYGHVHTDSRVELKAMYDKVMQGAPSAEAEIKVLQGTEVRWLKHRLTTLFKDGQAIGALGTAEDITTEKTMFLKLESEIRKRTSLESTICGKGYYDLTDDLIIEYDTTRLVEEPERKLQSYSDVIAAIVKQIPNKLQKERFQQLVLAENLKQMFNEGKNSVEYEYRRLTPRGDISWVNTSVLLTKHPSNGHVMAFMYTTDINEKKLAHEVIDAITTAEYDYIMLVDVVKDSYTMFSHNVHCAELMPAMGQNYWQDLWDYLEKILSKEDAQQMRLARTKNRILDVLGKERLCEFVSNVIEPDGNKLIKKIHYSYLPASTQYLLVTCADITHVMTKESEQQKSLQAALIAAKQASSAKSEFLSRMSHEIRTPMNAILGMSALAAQSIGNDEETRDCIAKIGISGHYLLTLINDILDMSRIESGKMLLHNAPFSFPEFIGGINTVIYGQAEKKGVNYETIVAHGIDDGYIGDAMKLQQVLINVLGNAVKFTPSGGKITFSISMVEKNEKTTKIRFAVNDTGCGIADEAQERIFEAFEQQDAETSPLYGGTGLGLAISKSLTELMGGTIRVRSIVDVGSEFVIEVPLEIDQSIVVKHRPARYSFADLRTLIVDDDLMVCEQTAGVLKDIGMIPEWVTSGKEAVTRVKSLWGANKRFDFILVDWKMPDMDGIETSRQIRRIVGPDVTIIIITAYDWASIEQEAIAAGVNMCINKPMFKSTLISAFTKASGKAERLRSENVKQDFDFTGKRILLAEDHPLNAEIAMKLLGRKNCLVEHVENGLKALEKFTTTPVGYYDAILMDVRMPIMDGLQATTNIRNWNKADAKIIPIIAMTANAFDEDVDKSKSAGMDAHLAKPIDPQLLFRVLYRLIN